MEDRLITVAIHTYERALEVKALLENEGVAVALQNVNLSHPVVASGVRVRIHEHDLPLALRIIENCELFQSHANQKPTSATDKNILVPIDFSGHSLQAARIAFKFAASLNSNIILLHTFVDPTVANTLQLSDTLNYDIANSEAQQALIKEARGRLNTFTSEIKESIKKGELPPVKFTHDIREGVPEDVITNIAKTLQPELIVMGTRGANTKEKELVGSVTAEVLDTCRFPVFTLPADSPLDKLENISHILFFCTLDQQDILALDTLCRLLPEPGPQTHITLVNIPSKKQPNDIQQPFDALRKYCDEHYPTFTFSTCKFTLASVDDDFATLTSHRKVDLIVVPNKKKNIFSRLFNPGLAHRLLFHADIPMMVLPV